ncbi:MAG TPA: adenylate/guanylate cyclase domain-containing protein [bacterium]|nr:adenylate/guanylate cyclase domain-containing protein [bacterium]
MAEERRLVTVLFADVAGSTALGEQRDPEDVRALLGRFYAIAKEVIGVHGGTLEKFIGDAIMAVFGLPHAHGDDAERALAAALELRDRVQGDVLLGAQLPIRIGVDTGEVVAARDSAAGDFLITGGAVNTAARLQQAAEPWMILCGERTARAAVRRFSFGPPSAVLAKGKTQPVGTRSVLGRTAAAVPLRVPLIGRDADLAQLELAARRAFGERRPFLLSLIAPAGIGKSRLLEEFLDRLPATGVEATVAIAQCLPYGQRLTYWPLRTVLFRLAGLAEDAEAAVARDRIFLWLENSGVESSRRTGDLLAATIGLGETEAVDRAALFAAWRTAIEAASRQSPLVVVFEDLHWSSDSLLDLAEFVMQPRGDAPLLMIALARPELLDRRPSWGGGRRNYISLSLEPLADDAVAALVEHMIGGSSREIVERVVTRAEGNPFYAGEIVRSVMDRVPSLDDVSAVERALATLPDTVHATILARLDILPFQERRLLQVGAVFGRAFRAAGVAALEPDLLPHSESATEELVVKDLIRPSDTDRFAFRHILIQEVAYQTLPRAERARLHAAAGAWLENRAAGQEEALAEIIAYHYREATSVSPRPEGETGQTELRRKGAAWLTRAADVATAAAALGEAARHLQRAIELADPGELPDLYERLGYVQAGDAAAEAYLTGLRLCREAGRSPDQELRLVASLLMLYTRFGGSMSTRPSGDELGRLRAEGRALLERAGDKRAVAAFLVAEAFIPFWRVGGGAAAVAPSEITEAERSARRGLDVAEELDDARLRSAALDGLSSLAQQRGTWEEAREWARQRLTFQDRLDLQERMDAYSMATWTSVHLGDLDDADRVSTEGLALLQPGQAVAWALHLAAWRTYALALMGRWDEALVTADRTRALWAESGVLSAGYAVRGFLAGLDVARARRDEPRMEAFRDTLERIIRSLDRTRYLVRILPYLAGDLEQLEEKVIRNFTPGGSGPDALERTLSLCCDRGHAVSAELLPPIVEFAGRHGHRILEAQAWRALGMARQETLEFRRALELFERTGAVPYVARVRCERALITSDEGEMTAGLKILEALGDAEQTARFEQERKH